MRDQTRGESKSIRVLGLVDHTHPTTTQLLCDFVVGDGLADHGGSERILLFLQYEKPGRVVVEDVSLLLLGQECSRLDSFNGHLNGLRPNHLI